MIVLVILGLFFLINIDRQLQEMRGPELYKDVFELSSRVIFLFLTALFLGLLIFIDQAEDILMLAGIAALGWYLMKRVRFYARLRERPQEVFEIPLSDEERHVRKNERLKSDAIGVVLAFFFSLLCVSLIIKGVTQMVPAWKSTLGSMLITAIVTSAVLMVLVYQASKNISDKKFSRVMRIDTPEVPWGKRIFWPALGGLFFAVLSAAIIVGRKVQPSTPLSEAVVESGSGTLLGLFLLLAIFMAPLVEEVAFRGYFYLVIEKVKGRLTALLSITAVFAVLHVGQYWGDWLAILMVAALGFALTWVRAYVGSTMSCMVMHFVYNSGVTILPVIFLYMANPYYVQYQARLPELTFQEKETLLQQSIQREPELAEAYHELAWLYVDNDMKLVRALESIDKALALDEDNPDYLHTKAMILEKWGLDEKAEAVWNRLDQVSQ